MMLLILDASNSQHQRAWNMTERGGLLVGIEAAPLQPTLCATRHAVRCPLFCGACPTSSCVV